MRNATQQIYLDDSLELPTDARFYVISISNFYVRFALFFTPTPGCVNLKQKQLSLPLDPLCD